MLSSTNGASGIQRLLRATPGTRPSRLRLLCNARPLSIQQSLRAYAQFQAGLRLSAFLEVGTRGVGRHRCHERALGPDRLPRRVAQISPQPRDADESSMLSPRHGAPGDRTRRRRLWEAGSPLRASTNDRFSRSIRAPGENTRADVPRTIKRSAGLRRKTRMKCVRRVVRDHRAARGPLDARPVNAGSHLLLNSTFGDVLAIHGAHVPATRSAKY